MSGKHGAGRRSEPPLQRSEVHPCLHHPNPLSTPASACAQWAKGPACRKEKEVALRYRTIVNQCEQLSTAASSRQQSSATIATTFLTCAASKHTLSCPRKKISTHHERDLTHVVYRSGYLSESLGSDKLHMASAVGLAAAKKIRQ